MTDRKGQEFRSGIALLREAPVMQDHAHHEHVYARQGILEKVAVEKSDPVLKPKGRDVFFEEWPYQRQI